MVSLSRSPFLLVAVPDSTNNISMKGFLLVYLLFSIAWLVLAAALLTGLINPTMPGASFEWDGQMVSAGWLALMLGLYNLARWYSRWSFSEMRRQGSEFNR